MADATTFSFKAMDLAGSASTGELDAESKGQVSEQLRQRGLIVLDVSEKKEPINIEDIFARWQGVDMRALAVFSRQFATLVASGMPMLRTLSTLEEQTQEEKIKKAVASVRNDVEAGSTLEQAMERHPKVFDRLFRRWSAPASSRGDSRTRSTGSPSRLRNPTRCDARSNRR